ncbi:MerR family transcriptional regulator [Hymenobacter lapidiphilus]|uniref:MerR family transcriptional regulator n=1 Tax=Hymenobacter lapidiphilus TaxID=2608003 RepID=A0A7Y7PSB7_9BACT|nr:MerR family transcriptional regulator [Hymenobacter lapidiphilus]NVO33126.1 MerR family transcriptional regulator [Hymenobacter lapidiphilus]
MAQYLIGDLAQITGIKAHTIRTWELRYGLLTPRRTANNLRHYDDDDLHRLLHVASLCGHGWRISRVMQLSETERTQAAAQLQATVSTSFAARLNALMTAMLDLDEPRLHYLLTDAINDQGLEPVMVHLVYPLLQRIGLAWQTGALNIAQEHLLSQLVRQKMLAALDALPSYPPAGAARWLLFLPEGEEHELALLFMAYGLRRRGQQVLYLGQSMPLPDVGAACASFKPGIVLTVLTAGMMPERVGEFGQTLRALCPGCQLLFCGSLARHLSTQLPPGAEYISRITDVLEHLDAGRVW